MQPFFIPEMSATFQATEGNVLTEPRASGQIRWFGAPSQDGSTIRAGDIEVDVMPPEVRGAPPNSPQSVH